MPICASQHALHALHGKQANLQRQLNLSEGSFIMDPFQEACEASARQKINLLFNFNPSPSNPVFGGNRIMSFR